MITLLRIEFLKISRMRLSWVALVLFFLLQFLILYYLGDVKTGPRDENGVQNLSFRSFGLYNWPNVWHNLSYLAGFLKFLPALLVIVWVTSEFQYRTLRQNLIDGLSRPQWVTSKMLSITLLTLIASAFLFKVVVLTGLTNNSKIPEAGYFQHLSYFWAYTLEIWFMLIFALFTGILFRKTGVAVILFMGYYLFLEPLVSFLVPEAIAGYLPTQPARDLIPNPLPRMLSVDGMLGTETDLSVKKASVLGTLAWSLIFTLLSYLLVNRKDQ